MRVNAVPTATPASIQLLSATSRGTVGRPRPRDWVRSVRSWMRPVPRSAEVARVMVGWDSPVASTSSLRVTMGVSRIRWRHFAAGVRGRVNTGPGLIMGQV